MTRGFVLVVDDDASIATSLERSLSLEGYRVQTLSAGSGVAETVRQQRPDLLVLDVGLPDVDGVTVTRRLREAGQDVPICILSARDETSDRVAGLQAGADDYLVKPFELVELLARIEALLRRRPPAGDRLQVGSLVVDPPGRSASRGDRTLTLTKREFDLLELFARNPDVVLSRAQILEAVWGYDWDVETNVVDVFVGYLRSKLEADGGDRLLHTVRGVGFVLRRH